MYLSSISASGAAPQTSNSVPPPGGLGYYLFNVEPTTSLNGGGPSAGASLSTLPSWANLTTSGDSFWSGGSGYSFTTINANGVSYKTGTAYQNNSGPTTLASVTLSTGVPSSFELWVYADNADQGNQTSITLSSGSSSASYSDSGAGQLNHFYGFDVTSAQPGDVLNMVFTANGTVRLGGIAIDSLGVPTTTAVTSSNPSPLFGQTETFTATVSPSSGSGETGTVQFQIDGSNIGSPVALNGSTATYTTSSLSPGSHSVVAIYSGDSNFAPSTSPALTQVVDGLPTITSADTASFYIGTANSFTFQTAGYPVPSISESGALQRKWYSHPVRHTDIENGRNLSTHDYCNQWLVTKRIAVVQPCDCFYFVDRAIRFHTSHGQFCSSARRSWILLLQRRANFKSYERWSERWIEPFCTSGMGRSQYVRGQLLHRRQQSSIQHSKCQRRQL
jgi:hypothetical protein